MKRILVGYVQDGRHSGIDKYLIGFCRVAHDEGVQLDLLTDEVTESMKECLDGFGFGLIAVPSLKRPIAQYNEIKSIIKQNGYDGVYANISESFNCMLLLAAKACHVPCRMAHSHSSGVDRAGKLSRLVRTALNFVFRPILNNATTHRYACSVLAGKWLFGGADCTVIYNAVDAARFTFNAAARLNTRNELDISDSMVYIHIGNFCYQKNHFFLMDVMSSISKRADNAVLLCVGTGTDFDAVQDYANKLGIADRVRFLGVRDDVPALLSAAAALIFPSRFEGLGIACIEAQMSGLPCIIADTLPRDAQISPNVKVLPLGNAESWAQTALDAIGERKDAVLLDGALQNYDIANQRRQLAEILKG